MKLRLRRKSLLLVAISASVVLFAVDAPVGASGPGQGMHAITALASLASAGFTGPPSLPHAFVLPGAPIVAAASVGYLPGSGGVGSGGSYQYAIPLSLPEGRSGMAPSMALSYSSEAGNGLVGAGWSISGGGFVVPCGKTLASDGVVDGVAYGPGDRYCLNGARLVMEGAMTAGVAPTYGGDNVAYRTENESYTRIVSKGTSATGDGAPARFVVYTKSGLIQTYDAVAATQVVAQRDGHPQSLRNVTAFWSLTSETDRFGNTISYEYDADRSIGPNVADFWLDYRLRRIRYTGHADPTTQQVDQVPQRSVELVYEDRPDPDFRWADGVQQVRRKRLKSVEMYAPNPTTTSKVWWYELQYEARLSPTSNHSRLASVRQCATAGGCTWSKQFDWASHGETSALATPQFAQSAPYYAPLDNGALSPPVTDSDDTPPPALQVLDLNGDGADDIVYHLGNSGGASPWFDFSTPHYARLSKRSATSGDLVPLGGTQANALSGTAPITVPRQTIGSYGKVRLEQSFVVDTNGDGKAELFTAQHYDPTATGDSTFNYCGWRTTRWTGQVLDSSTGPSAACENVAPDSTVPAYRLPQIMFGDLNGDGLPDLIRAQQTSQTIVPPDITPADLGVYAPHWHTALNNSDGIPGKLAPAVDKGMGVCPARIADLNGDGKADIVTAPIVKKLGNGEYYFASEKYDGSQSTCGTTADDDRGYVLGSSYVAQSNADPNSPAASQRFANGGNKRFADFNGDGLEDYIVFPDEANPLTTPDKHNIVGQVYWNVGGSFYPDSHTLTVPVDVVADDIHMTDRGIRIVDFNRDGRADVLTFHNQSVAGSPTNALTVLLSKGDGTFERSHLNLGLPGTRMDAKRVPFKKENYIPSYMQANSLDDVAYMFLTMQHPDPGVYPDMASEPGTARGWALAQVGDFNGDGAIDVIRHVGQTAVDPHFEVLQQATTFGDRITRVFDQPTAWPREEVTYSTEWSSHPKDKDLKSCTYPQRCIRSGLVVVRALGSRDHVVDPAATGPVPAAHWVYYAYENPVSDMRGRGFLGFGETSVFDPEIPSESVTTYDVQSLQADASTGTYYYPKAGLPTWQGTTTALLPSALVVGQPVASKPVSVTKARIKIDTVEDIDTRVRNFGFGNTYVTFRTGTTNKTFESELTEPYQFRIDYGSGALAQLNVNNVSGRHIYSTADTLTMSSSQASTTSSVYDDYGNPTSVTSAVVGGSSATTQTTYINQTNAWLLGMPVTQRTTSQEPGVGQAIREIAYDVSTVTGQLKSMTVQPGGTADITATTSFEYDAYGHVIKTTAQTANAPARVAHIEYQPLYPGAPDERIFASQSWTEHDNPACTVDCRPSMWFVVHPAYSVPIAGMDLNGVQNTTIYDALGRPVWSQADGEQALTLSYAGRPDTYAGFNGLISTAQSGGQTAISASDARGGALWSSVLGFDGTPVRSSVVYDLLGRVTKASRPYQGTTPTAWSTNAYDSLGRTLSNTAPNGALACMSYPSLFETRQWTLPAGQTCDASSTLRMSESYVQSDINGRTLTSGQLLFGTPTTDLKVGFHYAPFNLVDRVTQANGTVTATQYDVLGRPWSQTDPDRGETQIKYDGFGQVVQSLHVPTGQTTTTAYDDLGRQRMIKSADGITSFTWDTAANGVGQLDTSTSADGILTRTRYDALGRPSSSDLVDETGATYTVDLSYDPLGRLDTLAYPNKAKGRPRLKLKYDYDVRSNLTKINDVSDTTQIKSIWSVSARNADGALVDGWLGDQALALHRDYDAVMGRLTKMSALRASSLVASTEYTYKPTGLIDTRTTHDGIAQRVETFGYDSLARLTNWRLASGSDLPGSLLVAAPAVEYRYDVAGNLTEIWKGGSKIENRSYGQNGLGPHALTQLQKLQGGTVQSSINYSYDKLGRMTKDAARSLTYTTFDLPKSVTTANGTVGFRYDAGGARVKKTASDGTTLYVGGLYERRQPTSGAVTHVYHVTATDGAVAQVEYVEPVAPATVGTSTTRFPLTDALGSTSVVTNAQGVATERDYYDPFGQRIAADGQAIAAPNSTVHEGYTGQEHDDALGLINFRGRMYDPAMKRFLTPDPIVADAGHSQAWNPYSYVMNSPLNRIDPSGYNSCWNGTNGDVVCSEAFIQGRDQTPNYGQEKVNFGPPAEAKSEVIDESGPSGPGVAAASDTSADSAGRKGGMRYKVGEGMVPASPQEMAAMQNRIAADAKSQHARDFWNDYMEAAKLTGHYEEGAAGFKLGAATMGVANGGKKKLAAQLLIEAAVAHSLSKPAPVPQKRPSRFGKGMGGLQDVHEDLAGIPEARLAALRTAATRDLDTIANNCPGNCLAADAARAGAPYGSAVEIWNGGNGAPYTSDHVSVYEAQFGGTFHVGKSRNEMNALVGNWGDGARGIVFAHNGFGDGHFYNVENVAGRAISFDKSHGTVGVSPAATFFDVIRTDQ